MEDLKEKLIFKRLEKVYCKLASSKIHGVGVFAIKDIPKGTNPFNNSYMAQESIVVNKNKIKDLDPEILHLLNDYHPGTTDKQIISSFPNQPIWTNYINYSENPNIQLMETGEWMTICDIKKGSELLENPKNLLNENGTLKSFIIKPKQYPLLHY
jgi:SET domain-containing protein